MLAALAAALGESGGAYALAGEAAAGVGPAIPGAASASKQAAQSLLSVSTNLQKTKKAADEAVKGGTSYADSLKGVHSQYQQGAGILQSVTGKLAAAGTTIAATLTGGIVALQALSDPIAQLTGLSNPAALDAFTRAVNDDFAVVGRALLPVTEAFTRAFQKLGVFLVQAEPILNTVAAAFGQLIDQVGDEWLDAMQNAGPVLQVMADVLIDVAKEAAAFATVFLRVGKVLRDLLGLGGGGLADRDKSSAKGAAVRDVRVVSSAERVANEAQEKALRQALNPGAAAKDPVELQAEGNGFLGEIRDAVKLFSDPLSKALALYLAVRDAVNKAGDSGGGAVQTGADVAGVGGFLRLAKSMMTRR